jgi:hypothetical protein
MATSDVKVYQDNGTTFDETTLQVVPAVLTNKKHKIADTLGTDHTADGITMTATAGEAFVFGECGYLKSDGKVWKGDADGTATYPVAVMAIESISANAAGEFLLIGKARDDSWAWTIGGLLYISTTAGALTQTMPTAQDNAVQAVGVAFPNADTILFGVNLNFMIRNV